MVSGTLEKRALPYGWDRVKEELQGRLPSLLAELGIKDAPRNGLIHPLNPNRNDRRPGSFVIWTQGDAAGAFKDYACGDAGDVFGLIEYLASPRPASKMDVYWWALNWLGWSRNEVRTRAEDTAARERREREIRAAHARQAALDAAKSADLFKLWLSLPPITGTPAETYLREVRGLPIERMKHQPGALRWAERAEWVDPETGEVREWPHCMVSAVTVGSKVTGLHRTFLLPDGSGKNPHRKSKTMIGSCRGGAIRISPGASGLTPVKAAAKGRLDPLIITEGIEDALTLAIARPDCRVWAAGSLSLMGALEWPACASAVVLAADNDWDTPAAMAEFSRIEGLWRKAAQGRDVHVIRAAAGKDFNDMAREAVA